MARKAHVFSTLANDNAYSTWLPGGADLPIKDRTILIKGGAGVANDRIITPLGVCTEIDEADLAVLERNPDFCAHKERGYIVVRKTAADPEKVATDMNPDDPSRPVTPADYIEGEDGPAGVSVL